MLSQLSTQRSKNKEYWELLRNISYVHPATHLIGTDSVASIQAHKQGARLATGAN